MDHVTKWNSTPGRPSGLPPRLASALDMSQNAAFLGPLDPHAMLRGAMAASSSIVLHFQKRRLLRSILSPISLSYPDRLVTPAAWAGHIPFAFWLTATHRPSLLVELGTYTGNSYSAFTQAVQANQLDTRCFAIDTWRGDEHSGFYSGLRVRRIFTLPRCALFAFFSAGAVDL